MRTGILIDKPKAGRQKDLRPEGVTHNEEAIMRPEGGGGRASQYPI